MTPIRAWSLRYSTVASVVVVIGVIKFFTLTLLSRSDPIVPDETGYSEFVSFLAQGGDPSDWIGGYGAYLIRGSGALIQPGVILSHAGLSGLDAIRVISSAYMTASSLLLVLLIRSTSSHATNSKQLSIWSIPFAGLLLYVCLPSHALWGVLGLKDSASDFFLMLALVMAVLAFHTDSWAKKAPLLLGLALAVAGMFTARYYMSYLLALAIMAAYLVPRIVKGRIGWSVAATALLGVAFGQLAFHPANTRPDTTAVVETLNNIPVQRESMAVGADSAFSVGYCPQTLGIQERLLCEAQNLPAASVRVMFSPLAVTDADARGAMVRLAVFENYIWIAIVFSFLAVLVMTRSRSPRGTLSAALLCIAILLVLGLVSGNAGTAFRHKAQLLVGISVVFALSDTVRRPTKSPKINRDV